MSKIVIVLVNYNNIESLTSFCQRVYDIASYPDVIITVADNSGCLNNKNNINYLNLLRDLRVEIYDSKSNVGYFPGAALAFQNLLAKISEPDFTIVANTDIFFRDPNFFKELCSKNYSTDILAIGPSIELDLGGKLFPQNPMKMERFSSRGMLIRKFIYKHRMSSILNSFLAYLRRRLSKQPARFNLAAPVYMIHGSFMIFTRNYFMETSGLNFPSFLYGEEIYVAEEIRRAGKVVLYDPSLSIIHKGGETTSLIRKSLQDKYIYESFSALYERYFK